MTTALFDTRRPSSRTHTPIVAGPFQNAERQDGSLTGGLILKSPVRSHLFAL